MILSCQNINKAFGTDVILKNASFHIEDREKAAVVGINGAGKSTLLKIIVGDLDADSGEAVLSKGKTLGYLAQHQELESEHTIYEELLTVKQDVLDLERDMHCLLYSSIIDLPASGLYASDEGTLCNDHSADNQKHQNDNPGSHRSKRSRQRLTDCLLYTSRCV